MDSAFLPNSMIFLPLGALSGRFHRHALHLSADAVLLVAARTPLERSARRGCDRRDQQRRQPWRIPGTESHAVGGSRYGEQRCPHGCPCDLFDRARNRRLGRAPVLKEETGPRGSVSCHAKPGQPRFGLRACLSVDS